MPEITVIAGADLFAGPASAPVNAVGAMGAGLAKQFRNRYPEIDAPYRATVAPASRPPAQWPRAKPVAARPSSAYPSSSAGIKQGKDSRQFRSRHPARGPGIAIRDMGDLPPGHLAAANPETPTAYELLNGSVQVAMLNRGCYRIGLGDHIAAGFTHYVRQQMQSPSTHHRRPG